ncbi:MAG: HAD family phosphatase [Lachnospiraceae bacterium]|nr:HAD family phosphatase [Lachnospiraceae bacterium]
MIKNVIFDIGRVLIGFDWKDYMDELFEDEAVKQKVSEAAWQSGWWTELDRNVISEKEVFAKLREAAGEYGDQFDIAIKNMGKLLAKKDYAARWVKELKSKGYNVYYLSNYFEYAVKANPDALEFIDYMDGGVFSYQEKIIKPSPAIYECLMDRYGLKPEECLFTDDSQNNVNAARELGMRAIRFDGYEKMYPVIMGYLDSPKNGEPIADLDGDGLPIDGIDFSKWTK